MEVILLENVRNLGALGDKVKVKAGYGRNFLIPKGKAVYATVESIAKFELRRAELEKIAAEAVKDALIKKEAITNLATVTVPAKAGEEGKLFGSVGTRDIAAAITKAGVEVSKAEVVLPAGVLRQVGEYEITIELHGDINALIKIAVVPET